MLRMIFLLILLSPFGLFGQAIGHLKPFGPVPTASQLQWHEMEFYLFVHFGPNTFTDKEWGEGNEPADAFNPTSLDTRQWCRVAKQAGAKGIIITAKHHDGFCLWPSKYSKHTVRESKWKNGQGDVLKELSDACREYGLKFGVYISPWDRNHPTYGTPEYNTVFMNMIRELFTGYGPIWELWWDGANGEGPNGKRQEYDWAAYKKLVKEISPSTVVFSDVGPHIRWIGNEKGIAGTTNWNLLDTAGFSAGHGAPHVDTLNRGNVNGKNWIPGEADVSIRPGWFFHEGENDKVKTPAQLFDLYLKSVGRGVNLLLNVPPGRDGKIHGNDSSSLVGFKKLVDSSFHPSKMIRHQRFSLDNVASFVLFENRKKAVYNFVGRDKASIEMKFKSPATINCIVLREPIEFGQKISSIEILLKSDAGEQLIKATTVGRKRILTFPATKISSVVVRIPGSKAMPALSEISFYRINDGLVEKQ